MDIRKFFGGGKAAAAKAAPATKAATATKTTKKTPQPSMAKSSPKLKKKEAKKLPVVVIDSDSDDAPIKVQQGNNIHGKSQEKTMAKVKVKDVALPTAETSPSEKENKATKVKVAEKRETKKGANKRDKSEDKKVDKGKQDKYEESKAGKEDTDNESTAGKSNEEQVKASKKARDEEEKSARSIKEKVEESKPVNGEEERKSAKSKKVKGEDSKLAKSKRAKFGDSKVVTSKHERDEAEKTKKEQAEVKRREQSEERKAGKRKSTIIVDSSDEEEFSSKRKTRKSSKSKKGAIIFDTDSDEEPTPLTQGGKRSRKKKPTNLASDSDEEDRQVSIIDAFKKVTRKNSPKKTAKFVEKPKGQACSMTDFFGSSTPVHRVERKLLPVKRKAEESPPRKDVVTIMDDDMEIQDDDEFEQTLMLLDTSEAGLEEATKQNVEPSSAPSLASKLSSRLKKEETWVEQTPDRKKTRLVSEMEIIAETPKRNRSPSKAQVKTSPVKKSPAKNSPVKKSPLKMSPVKVSPFKTSPKKAQTPVTLTSTPKPVPQKSNVEETPGSDDSTPKGGRGGPGYRSYLNRAPPQALGSKEIPEGAPNCLEGLTFVISGVLESLERDDAKSLVERCGGKVTTSISKRTSYIVSGRDAGVSKTAKAEELGTKQLDEDGLLDLIQSAKGKKSKYELKAEADAAKEKKNTPKAAQKAISRTATPQPSPSTIQPSPSSMRPSSSIAQPSPATMRPSPSVARTSPTARPSPSQTRLSVASSPAASNPHVASITASSEPSLMWVDKYKPTSLKQVIGQQGPKSNANKLLNWLRNWHRWQAEGRKPAFNNRFNDDGAGYRAALLSGPPGVGKTTTSTLVCQEVGFSYVELNASDTRSKKSLETEVSELLGNHTLVDFFGADSWGANTHSKATEGKMHCLIMDEVDGMAGNEDRGGMQELITLIKKSRIPIICMCNDRNHQKVRSLANYCFDLRFQRPRIEQIKAAMMSMAYKEGLKIPPPALNEVISAANQDVRQVIHNLSMWTAVDKVVTYDQMKKDAAKAVKDMKMGPFDVCRKVFVGGEETAKMSINDKSDLFFHDYSFGPLFVQENYLYASPYTAGGNRQKVLQCVSRAIDSIADGDLVDRQIRSKQNWSLLPLQAMYSSVIPGEAMRGGFSHMVQFPQWLGKNSSRNKTDRILQELHTHMSLKLSGDRRALNMDYIPHFRRSLTCPLINEGSAGVPEIIATLHEYDLLREDYDNILDISQWSHLKDALLGVDPKTKAAFTRTYNKEAHLTPYAAVITAKKGRGRGGTAAADTDLMGDEDKAAMAVDDAESDEDVEMFKAKKKPKARGAAAATDSAKGKGRGKATGQGRGRGRGKAN